MCVVIKSPPYEVTECGYGSFECRIDVYFRNKGDPRKLTFMHDLVLTLDKTPDPVVAARYEKLTFRSPSEEFAQRLLRAGGVSSLFCYLLTLLIVYPFDSSCFSISYPYCFLWPPYVIGGPLYFCPVVSFFFLSFYLSFFIPRLISAAAGWMSTIP